MFHFRLPGQGLEGRARLYEIVRCTTFWICVVIAADWAADRQPPLQVLALRPIRAAPGATAQFELMVARDLRRGCAVRFHRYLYDGEGFRFDLGGPAAMNAQALAALEREHPGQLLLSVPVPQRATPGAARFVTSLDYVCNPLHHLWPIPLLLEVPFTIT